MTPAYQTEDATLYHADWRDILPTLADGSVAAIVTDPPYGTEAERDGYGRRYHNDGIGRFIAGDSDLSELDGMLAGAGRVLAADAWLAVFCSPKRHAEAAALMGSHGFPVCGEVVWDKATPGLGGGIRYQHETVLLSRRGNAAGRDALFSVLRAFVPREGKHRRHPHEKPTEVMTALVRYCSRPGELVFDPFAGSGTTLRACLKTGRKGVGCEVSGDWIPTIIRRLEDARTPLFTGLAR